MFKIIARIAQTVTLLCAAAVLGAWGNEGHQIVGKIAEANLTPKAKQAVDRILATEDLPRAATWADRIRPFPEYAWSKPLHYADLRRGESDFVFSRDCPNEGCVVQAIHEYAAALGDPGTPREMQLTALRFLAHFVGDVHQPLHAGFAEDKGGNDISVSFFGKTSRLHAVWDTGLIRRLDGNNWETTAARLLASVKAAEKSEWTAGLDPTEWANESHQLAVGVAYKARDGDTLAEPYAQRATPVVEAQLKKAGIRLAAVLNQIFDPQQGSPPLTTAAAGGAPPAASAVMFVGSRRSEVYHYPGCPQAEQIAEENLVEYTAAPPGKHLHRGCKAE